MQTVRRSLDRYAAAAVGNEPVQLRTRQLGSKGRAVDDHARERTARLGNVGARAEQPWDERVLRDRGHTPRHRRIHRVADEVQPRDAQPFFVDRVIIKRVVILNMRHADHGMMPVERAAVQADGIVARHDRHVLAVGKFVVKVAAEIKIAVAVSRCGTHGARPPSFIHPLSISAVPVRMLKILKRTCVQSVSFMCLTLPRKKPAAFLCCRRISSIDCELHHSAISCAKMATVKAAAAIHDKTHCITLSKCLESVISNIKYQITTISPNHE